MTIKDKGLADAFYETLKDVYWAEKQSVKACKKSAKESKSASLKDAFTTHAEESAHQVERLTQVFEIIDKPARAKTCEATQGILAEMDEDVGDFGGTEAADDVLIGCAQALEHYEIARYGMLTAWAKRMGLTEAAALLQETLDEEKAADQKLSAIADGFPPLLRAA
jgi:ferritin-like metal-binding protein YciE